MIEVVIIQLVKKGGYQLKQVQIYENSIAVTTLAGPYVDIDAARQEADKEYDLTYKRKVWTKHEGEVWM